MADIDLSGLNIDQLTQLVGKAQTEVASREKQRRKDLRTEIERRVGELARELKDPAAAPMVVPQAQGEVRNLRALPGQEAVG